MNNRFILVYDFETCGPPDPLIAEPVQLAAKVLHPRTLEVVKNGEFHTFIQPPGPVIQESIDWHAKTRKITAEEVVALWANGLPQKQAWDEFAEFTLKFHTPTKKKSWFSAPIRAGCNIVGFDNVIWQRMCERYGYIDAKNKDRQSLAFPRDNMDIQPMLFWWFENYGDGPDNLNMDILREYFAIDSKMGHDAMSDVDDTILIIRSYSGLFRRTTQKIHEQGGFKGKLAGRRV